MTRSSLSYPILTFALVLGGCGSAESEEEFQYGEADMRAIAVGSFAGSLTLEGRAETTFELALEQAPPETSPQCDNRTFSHELCTPMSTLRLLGTLTSADGVFAGQEVTGSFDVHGMVLDSGNLQLSGAGAFLSSTYVSGAFEQGSVSGNETGSFTLARK